MHCRSSKMNVNQFLVNAINTLKIIHAITRGTDITSDLIIAPHLLVDTIIIFLKIMRRGTRDSVA